MFGRLKEPPDPQSLVGASTSPVTTPVEEDGGHKPSEGLILLVFTILAVGLSAYVLITSEHDAVKDPAQKAMRGEIKGLDPDSLVRQENLKKALAKIGQGSPKLITSLRIAPVRVDATVRDANGSRTIINVDPSFKTMTSDFGSGEDPGVSVAQIDAAAPERMLKAVAEKAGVSPDAIDYVTTTFSSPATERTWYMSLDGVSAHDDAWIAAANGTDVRRPGELSQAQQRENERIKRDIERRQHRLERQSQRRSFCLSNAQTAEAAARCIERFPL